MPVNVTPETRRSIPVRQDRPSLGEGAALVSAWKVQNRAEPFSASDYENYEDETNGRFFDNVISALAKVVK